MCVMQGWANYKFILFHEPTLTMWSRDYKSQSPALWLHKCLVQSESHFTMRKLAFTWLGGPSETVRVPLTSGHTEPHPGSATSLGSGPGQISSLLSQSPPLYMGTVASVWRLVLGLNTVTLFEPPTLSLYKGRAQRMVGGLLVLR